MPQTLSFPGVYIEEVPSGVRTITGVSTSKTAFVGPAKRGPIDEAVRVQSFGEFETQFGGLDAGSLMTYAIRQFFLNGGSDAWIVRIAKNATAARRTVLDGAGRDSIELVARGAGKQGNGIEVRIDYGSPPSASRFNLALSYTSSDNPADNRSERFENLSLNSKDGRYAVSVVNDASRLVTLERKTTDAQLGALPAGTSRSGSLVDDANVLLDFKSLVDAGHNQLQVEVNGLPAITVELPTGLAGPDAAADLETLRAAIQTRVRGAANGRAALQQFRCEINANTLLMTSGEGGELSSVHVLPGARNDVTPRLKLGTNNGGVETDAVAAIRPVETPARGSWRSGVFATADLNALPDATHTSLDLSLDAGGPVTVSLAPDVAAGANLAAKLTDVANRIQSAVRSIRNTPAFADFVARAEPNRLLLESGTRGEGSSVSVSAAAANSIAAELHLLAGSVPTAGTSFLLQGGNESEFKPDDPAAYGLYIGSRAQRKGIFALEAVDIFNILCLPGVADAGILADAAAYCREERAFFIIDSPEAVNDVPEMVNTARGSTLPKTENAAVYFPWIKAADPLQGGRVRTFPPSGTIAGLYARIDSSRGVWKAPAGTEANLTGAQGLAFTMTDGQNGQLNPLGVNCLRAFPERGIVSWGARTLAGSDALASEWKYVPVRRLALFIEESLYRGTQFVVFEPNDEPLWAQIRLNVGAFMNTLFRQGAFQGSSPRDAYFVKCDKETTTQNDINLGVVNILVGFAPLKPAEFVVIKLQQMAGQVQA